MLRRSTSVIVHVMEDTDGEWKQSKRGRTLGTGLIQSNTFWVAVTQLTQGSHLTQCGIATVALCA